MGPKSSKIKKYRKRSILGSTRNSILRNKMKKKPLAGKSSREDRLIFLIGQSTTSNSIGSSALRAIKRSTLSVAIRDFWRTTMRPIPKESSNLATRLNMCSMKRSRNSRKKRRTFGPNSTGSSAVKGATRWLKSTKPTNQTASTRLSSRRRSWTESISMRRRRDKRKRERPGNKRSGRRRSSGRRNWCDIKKRIQGKS